MSALNTKSNKKNYRILKDSEVNSIIDNIQKDVLSGHIRNGVCIIMPAEEETLKEVCEKIYNALSAYLGSEYKLSLSIGRIGKGPAGIQNSFIQAEQAMSLSETIKELNGIIYYDDLGAYRLLNKLIGKQELNEFHRETIGKLLQQDPNFELLKTLKTYFYYDEVMKTTANALFIHVNTLKYRISKIESITGCDLKKSEGKMNLFLGLKINELIHFNE